MRASRAESQSRPAELGAGASWPAAAPPRGRRATGLRTSVELRRDPGVLGPGACCGPSPLGRDHSRPWGDWSSRPLPPSALHAFASSLSRPSRPRASVQHVGWDGPPALHLFACSMCPHFVAIWIVFSIPPLFSCLTVIGSLMGPGHTHPRFEGRSSRRPPLMCCATGFIRPGYTVEAPRASSRDFGPDARGRLVPSLVRATFGCCVAPASQLTVEFCGLASADLLFSGWLLILRRG